MDGTGLVCLRYGREEAIKSIGSVFPDWYISVSFKHSTSKMFQQALALAKRAPLYLENLFDSGIVYQAIYSENENEFIEFIRLYEVVSNWKSCFIHINGDLIDKKIVGKIKWCYGDYCRSGNRKFCYGASELTQNPLGCHRLQISAYNNPWYSFGSLGTQNIWYVDKGAILERVENYAKIYKYCPKFNYDEIKRKVYLLPNTIDLKKEGSKYFYMGGRVYEDLDIKFSSSEIPYEGNKNSDLANTQDILERMYMDKEKQKMKEREDKEEAKHFEEKGNDYSEIAKRNKETINVAAIIGIAFIIIGIVLISTLYINGLSLGGLVKGFIGAVLIFTGIFILSF